MRSHARDEGLLKLVPNVRMRLSRRPAGVHRSEKTRVDASAESDVIQGETSHLATASDPAATLAASPKSRREFGNGADDWVSSTAEPQGWRCGSLLRCRGEVRMTCATSSDRHTSRVV